MVKTMPWNPNKSIRFLREVQKHDCLVNPASKESRSRYRRDLSWKDVTDTLQFEGLDPVSARKKWRNLKSSYYQEKSKVKKSLADGDKANIYTPMVKWFHVMKEIMASVGDPFPDGENVEGIFPNAAEDDGSSSNVNECSEVVLFKIDPNEEIKSKPNNYSFQLIDSPATHEEDYSIQSNNFSAIREEPPINTKYNHAKRTKQPSASKEELNKEDECMILARGYATKMKKLTTEELLCVDKIINEALFEAQTGELNRKSYIVHPEVPKKKNTTAKNGHWPVQNDPISEELSDDDNYVIHIKEEPENTT